MNGVLVLIVLVVGLGIGALLGSALTARRAVSVASRPPASTGDGKNRAVDGPAAVSSGGPDPRPAHTEPAPTSGAVDPTATYPSPTADPAPPLHPAPQSGPAAPTATEARPAAPPAPLAAPVPASVLATPAAPAGHADAWAAVAPASGPVTASVPAHASGGGAVAAAARTSAGAIASLLADAPVQHRAPVSAGALPAASAPGSIPAPAPAPGPAPTTITPVPALVPAVAAASLPAPAPMPVAAPDSLRPSYDSPPPATMLDSPPPPATMLASAMAPPAPSPSNRVLCAPLPVDLAEEVAKVPKRRREDFLPEAERGSESPLPQAELPPGFSDPITGLPLADAMRADIELRATDFRTFTVVVCHPMMARTTPGGMVNASPNASYGEEELRIFASVLRDSLRQKDIVGRYDERLFLLFLPRCKLDEVRIVMDRIRSRLLSTQPDQPQWVDITFGAAAGQIGESVDGPLKVAYADLLQRNTGPAWFL